MASAIRFATTVLSAPTPASSPLQARRLTTSLFMRPGSLARQGRRALRLGLEAAADRLDDQALGALVVLVRLREHVEDPGREQLLDRAVEAHRAELGGDVGLERAVGARLLDDPRDEAVGLLDLGRVVTAEGIRRTSDLHDDHLHQVGLVLVRVDDEAGDLVQLLARRLLALV